MELLRYIVFIVFISVVPCHLASTKSKYISQPVRRFPHHVFINSEIYTGEIRECSGSIISLNYIVSSSKCLYGSSQLSIYFNRLYYSQSTDDFAISISNKTVYHYPTGYDDLAIIELPVGLLNNTGAISLSKETDISTTFALMPGFNDFQNELTYEMFRIIPNENCENYYGDDFDEYLHICAKTWSTWNYIVCNGNMGGGLITGWPNNQNLIGILSKRNHCSQDIPAIFTKISKYIEWIQEITGIESTTSLPPTQSTTIYPTTNDETIPTTITTDTTKSDDFTSTSTISSETQTEETITDTETPTTIEIETIPTVESTETITSEPDTTKSDDLTSTSTISSETQTDETIIDTETPTTIDIETIPTVESTGTIPSETTHSDWTSIDTTSSEPETEKTTSRDNSTETTSTTTRRPQTSTTRSSAEHSSESSEETKEMI